MLKYHLHDAGYIFYIFFNQILVSLLYFLSDRFLPSYTFLSKIKLHFCLGSSSTTTTLFWKLFPFHLSFSFLYHVTCYLFLCFFMLFKSRCNRSSSTSEVRESFSFTEKNKLRGRGGTIINLAFLSLVISEQSLCF